MINLRSLFLFLLCIGMIGCELPSEPELTNVYDTAYDGGPFDFSILVQQNNAFQLRWRDNSTIGMDYEVTRVDVFSRTDTLGLEVPIAERSLQDQLPSLTDVYEYVFELAREDQSATTNWTVVGFGMESYFKLSNTDEIQFNPLNAPVLNAITGDGNRLFIWGNTDNQIYARDMSLLPTRLNLQSNMEGNASSHRAYLSVDNRTFCSTPFFDGIGIMDIRCWDTSSGQMIINEPRAIGHYISLNRAGYLAVMSENTLEWWRLNDGQLEETIEQIPGTPIDVTPDATIAFTATTATDATVRPVVLSSLTAMQKQTLRKAKIFSPGNQVIGDCSRYERGVSFYDASILLDNSNPSDGLLTTIPAAIDCAFSPDGSQVIIQYNSDDTNGLSIIPVSALPNVSTSSSVVSEASLFIPHQFDVSDVTWTSDNRLFTTGSDNVVQEWSFTPAIDIPRVDSFVVALQ